MPRPEHPRPQFFRPDWLSLNGTWQFEIDQGDSGLERGLCDRDLETAIVVPFAPESERSGVGNTDFLEAVWYRRSVRIPDAWHGKRILLHFQAVDHDATVWVGGVEVARHRGGFTPFTADLTDVAAAGDVAVIVVRARDRRHGIQARGKQSRSFENRACYYTRTTGIWQTVWLEAVPQIHMRRPRITPDVATSTIDVRVPVSANREGWTVRAVLSDDAGEVVRGEAQADLDLCPGVLLRVPPDRVRLWEPGSGHLYQLDLQLVDAEGAVVDDVASYAGLRSISVDGQAVRINGRRVFQRLVLDQGYWPETLMTAPSDEELAADIARALGAGFNGARLHQKVFEERYLYHADRLGFLAWGEFGDWGAATADGDGRTQRPTVSFVTQWLEAIARDYSHPCIVGWCPLNETYQVLDDEITTLDDATRALFLATKAADPTRPVLDASGYSHRVLETDVYDAHLYEQDPQRFAQAMAGLAEDEPYTNTLPDGPMSLPYRGQPYFCSEFGGIWWVSDAGETQHGDDDTASWGYGRRPRDEEDFYARFSGLVGVLLDDPRMFGYCYTQLTDVFQERNGVYRFDRGSKLDITRLRNAQQRPAAYEAASSDDNG